MTLVGRTIGSIRVIEQLGAGGMGEVYLGVDDRLQRRVAVKALRGDSRPDELSRARMLREARVLSQLDHPNICRLFDLVQDGEGDVLILELVEGRSLRDVITDDPPRARKLELASQIAAALVAAHALSVVHRDLKPDNIMVTDDGQVKVLDFGLARPLSSGPELAATEEVGSPPPPAATASGDWTLTEFGAVPGTPRFMSPEQARGEALTAASDMYSFGLVLQELLTGEAPFDRDLPLDVLLTKAMWGDTRSATGVDPPLATLIDELKSLSPSRRPSAQATAERLRWITEAPRRRLRRLTIATVACLLAAAALLSSIGFVRAARARTRAETSEQEALVAQREAEAVNAFLHDMLTSADPTEMGIDTRVVDVLDAAAERVAHDFADHPLTRAAVLDTLGGTYLALGEVDRGRDCLRQALDLRRDLLGAEAPRTLESMHALGVALGHGAGTDAAEALLRETWQLRARILGPEHPETLDTLNHYGRVLRVQRRFREAEQAVRQALEARRRTLGDDHPDTLASMLDLAKLDHDLENWNEADALLTECFQRRTATLGPAHPDTIDVLHSRGVHLSRRGLLEEGAATFRQVVDLVSEVHGPEHPRTLQAVTNLASVLSSQGRPAEAEELLRPTIEVMRRVLGDAHRSTFGAMRELGRSLVDQGRLAEAVEVFRRRWEDARRVLGEEHRATLENQSAYAYVLVDAGRFREAEAIYRQVLAARTRLFGAEAWPTLRTKRDLARALTARGSVDEAGRLHAEYEAGMEKLRQGTPEQG